MGGVWGALGRSTTRLDANVFCKGWNGRPSSEDIREPNEGVGAARLGRPCGHQPRIRVTKADSGYNHILRLDAARLVGDGVVGPTNRLPPVGEQNEHGGADGAGPRGRYRQLLGFLEAARDAGRAVRVVPRVNRSKDARIVGANRAGHCCSVGNVALRVRRVRTVAAEACRTAAGEPVSVGWGGDLGLEAVHVEAEPCATLAGPLKVTIPRREACSESESSPKKSIMSCDRSVWISATLAELSTTRTKSCIDAQEVGTGTAVHPSGRGSTGGLGGDGGSGGNGGGDGGDDGDGDEGGAFAAATENDMRRRRPDAGSSRLESAAEHGGM